MESKTTVFLKWSSKGDRNLDNSSLFMINPAAMIVSLDPRFSNLPATERLFQIFHNNAKMAARWERSPVNLKIFIFTIRWVEFGLKEEKGTVKSRFQPNTNNLDSDAGLSNRLSPRRQDRHYTYGHFTSDNSTKEYEVIRM